MKKEIVYVGDPMCSWCWGFSPVLNTIRGRYGSKAKFSVLVGGLRSGSRSPMDESLKEYIQQHWNEVIRRTGQEFSFEILNKPGFVYDTEPACRAVVTMRRLAPDAVLDFFEALHRVFYAENQDITQSAVLAKTASKFGISETAFMQRFGSIETRQETADDFFYIRRIGVTGFPSLLCKDEQGYLPIARGYEDFETLEPKIAALFKR